MVGWAEGLPPLVPEVSANHLLRCAESKNTPTQEVHPRGPVLNTEMGASDGPSHEISSKPQTWFSQTALDDGFLGLGSWDPSKYTFARTHACTHARAHACTHIHINPHA